MEKSNRIHNGNNHTIQYDGVCTFCNRNHRIIGFGGYLVGITVTKEIKCVLQTADKRLGLKKERSLAMKRFKQLIEWHSIVKQLSKFLDYFISKVNSYVLTEMLYGVLG